MDQQTIYLEMYKECCNQGRHHETQRSTITTVSFGVASAILAYIAKEGGSGRNLLGLSIFLTILGIIAAILSYKQYERFRLAMDRASQYRDAIDTLPPTVVGPAPAPILTPSLSTLKTAGDKYHRQKYPFIEPIRLHTLWLILFLLVAAAGGWFTFVAATTQPSGRSTQADEQLK
jgi:hypothetical protein